MENWKSEYNKYLAAQFNIENANIVFMLNESFFITPYSFTPSPHTHEQHEFFFVKQGSCAININGQEFRMYSNSFAVIPAGMYHNVRDISDDARIFPMRILFNKNQLRKDPTETDIFDMLDILINQNITPHIYKNCPAILSSANELSNAIQNINQFSYRQNCVIAIQLFLIEVIHHMKDLYQKTKILNDTDVIPEITKDNIHALLISEKKQIYINIITGYFETFYKDRLSLGKLAERLNISTRQTIRLLKDIYGTTFEKFLITTRIKVAKRLIAETDLPLDDEMARSVGYSTYRGLARAFQKIVGMTPFEYRRGVRDHSQ